MPFRLPESERLGYPVELGRDLWSQLPSLLSFERRSSCFVLTDENVLAAWGERFRDWVPEEALLVVRPGEASKSLEVATDLWRRLAVQGADRHSLLVAIGGGMVGDLGGFVASTFMRGMPCALVPTTLLSQVDASVGSKVGINFEGTKNLLGAFSPPTSVTIDLETLTTLSERDLRAGWSEILKHALIADAQLWSRCESAVIPNQAGIARAIGIKATIVIDDERERSARRLLNFGHTIGHAVEVESGALAGARYDDALRHGNALRHGEAVAIGMVAEARLSAEARRLTSEAAGEIEAKIARFGLPTRIPAGISVARLLQAIGSDKKKRGRRVEWTLLDAIGRGVHGIELPDSAVERVLVELGASA